MLVFDEGRGSRDGSRDGSGDGSGDSRGWGFRSCAGYGCGLGSCSGFGDSSGDGTCVDEVFGYSYEDRYGPDDCIGKGSGYFAGRGNDNGSGSGRGSDDNKRGV